MLVPLIKVMLIASPLDYLSNLLTDHQNIPNHIAMTPNCEGAAFTSTSILCVSFHVLLIVVVLNTYLLMLALYFQIAFLLLAQLRPLSTVPYHT